MSLNNEPLASPDQSQALCLTKEKIDRIFEIVDILEKISEGKESKEGALSLLWEIDYMLPFCGDITAVLRTEFTRKRIRDLREWRDKIYQKVFAFRQRLIIWGIRSIDEQKPFVCLEGQ